ncbi:MAG: hypothetical protein HZB38_17425 [Planctomycetes bacterium]|nr:hypothetical protein [Planctomycetota bacterium]
MLPLPVVWEREHRLADDDPLCDQFPQICKHLYNDDRPMVEAVVRETNRAAPLGPGA